MNPSQAELTRLSKLDRRVVEAARGVKVLSHLDWPAQSADSFLESWQRGEPKVPVIEYPTVDLSSSTAELKSVMAQCDRSHPVEDYLYRTARSYVQATALLAAAGSSSFTQHSRTIYGDPSEPLSAGQVPVAVAASHVMESTSGFLHDCRLREEDYCVMPEDVARQVREHASCFGEDPVEVVVDPSLSSKAAAGARRVRLRGSTCYSEADVPQLIQHELFVHTLTALNGQSQPILSSLGLGAPRTTRTQEGLALFAELITNSMDINRLRRVAARAVAIDMALRGADFVDVFGYFLEAGQTLKESYSSTQRIFRGTDLRGGSAFTKDGVYFQGLVGVHRFLRDAARDGRVDASLLLMAGRLRTTDVARLMPWMESGCIMRPRYLPGWIRTRSRLITFLLYSSLAAELHLDELDVPGEVADGN